MLYFFDVETGSRFNQLSGHLGPVRDVCWAYDESLLASCDTEVRVQQTARGLVDGMCVHRARARAKWELPGLYVTCVHTCCRVQ